MELSVAVPTLNDVEEARARIAGAAIRSPLVALSGGDGSIWLKLENLQPVGCFKSRGAASALGKMSPADLAGGVTTASAGNMARAVALEAKRRGVRCRVIVPDHAPRAKTDPVEQLGAEIVRVPFDDWWRLIEGHPHPAVLGRFLHPVADSDVIAGNGTIGLEIMEDLPDVDAILVPYGGGGLSSGIAAAAKAMKPGVRVFACEVETAAPLAASLEAGEPRVVPYTASFVDGIGGKSVVPAMWPIVRSLLDGSIVVSLDDVKRALRLLLEGNRTVAEGAGAASVAAALSGKAGAGRIACVVSGGNIDLDKLLEIVRGEASPSL
ncbi:MAG: threonine ammonia-lyase [Candidatus Eiseniibacteriota bacterium]